MNIAARVVTYSVDPDQADERAKGVAGHLLPASQQIHGYWGFLRLDLGDNKRMSILLFGFAASAQAARHVLCVSHVVRNSGRIQNRRWVTEDGFEGVRLRGGMKWRMDMRN
jgi:hypothetical protein